MNNNDMLSDVELQTLFAEAREDAPNPSQALWDQVLMDADMLQPEAAGLRRVSPAKLGFFASLLVAIGGWPSLAGLTTATLAGVWFGFTNPDTVSSSAVALLLPRSNSEEVLFEVEDFTPSLGGFAAILEEG